MIMIRKIGFILGLLPVFMQAAPQLLDQGVVLVSGPVANTVITHSDLHDKRSLDGTLIPQEQQVKMEVIRQKVIEEKMPVDDTAAEKYLANMKKNHDLSFEAIVEIAAELGRTVVELKELLNMQYLYDFFLHHKFRAHLVPTDEQIEEYCEKYPQYEAGWYKIVIASVDFNEENKQEVRKNIADITSGKKTKLKLAWSSPVKINEEDIAEDKQFIKKLAIDAVHAVKEGSVYKLYKLVDKQNKKKKSIDERKAAVIEALNRQMFVDKLQAYEKQMMKSVAVVDLLV